MANIHSTAIIDKTADLGANVSVGPYTVIEGDVTIADGCEIGPHVLIASGTRMGSGCRIFKGASIGEEPQDLKFGGEKTELIMGNNNVIREFCTINRGTTATGKTVIGSNCLFMAYCHVAHDCVIGDHFVAANTLNLAGHVTIGNHVGTGGTVAVVQFRHIGDHSFIGAYSLINQDVLPYALVAPDPVRIAGINKVGLERRGYDSPRRTAIRRAYKILLRSGLSQEAALVQLASEFPANTDIQLIIDFAQNSQRGLLRMATSGGDVD